MLKSTDGLLDLLGEMSLDLKIGLFFEKSLELVFVFDESIPSP